jgi:hypothetical protein
MSNHRDTDERLRTRLNTDQPGRERLCAAILAMDRSYSHVTPQRPEGGPDGGRDIEAIRDGIEVWGAVGFQNSVSDSPDDKWHAKAKFIKDLENALRHKPDLKGFVFFTNVDLTEAERNILEDAAREKGISFVELYWRERLRQALDSAEGLAYRYQYLSMPMSEAEQATFFSRFGTELHELITQQHESVVSRLDRLEFRHEMSCPVRELRCLVQLRQRYTTEELGHFRLLVEFQKQNQPSIWYGTESSHRLDEKHGAMLGQTAFVWMGHTEEKPRILDTHEWSGGPHDLILFGVTMSARFTGEIFDERLISLYASEGLEKKIAGLWVSVNGYAICEPREPREMHWFPTMPQCPWPDSAEGPVTRWMGCGLLEYFRLDWSTPRRLRDARSGKR